MKKRRSLFSVRVFLWTVELAAQDISGYMYADGGFDSGAEPCGRRALSDSPPATPSWTVRGCLIQKARRT